MNIQRIKDLPPLPQRAPDSHKGSCGKVLIIAGSPGMSGAACLAGMGALRGGSGLVFVATPAAIQSIVASVNPCYLTIPLELDSDSQLTSESTAHLLDQLPGFDAVAIGPGCGQHPWVRDLTVQLYSELEQTLIVDADALNSLAALETPLPDAAGPRILTPHPGEFSRLTNVSIKDISADRETHAIQFAQKHQVVLVLKGAGTIVTDGTQLAVNQTGNAGMATGGTGDVLTGLTTSLAGQGMSPFDAAQLGVYLHGLAGDFAADDLSQPAMIAADLLDYIPDAWRELIAETN
ncbi:ATP-dependent (S)-NAD(P)H-hydrate dehydratase [Gimesia panareensis]|uniref:ADP-dependent (S)-NAD(P)H-hydrate dehydratase n=1 Tax=Gimesia panareensis TaxID=2527978 RepID=A0A517Q255_9PLAN|nr:NAD(P)H-hydrate dehydratase [Gimesia panareensis]QDT25708.1 ATP-dependent (S)-NAD(P)H-hydrate dehydratase [Gimesia panareensis]